jgi:hypothetical protein
MHHSSKLQNGSEVGLAHKKYHTFKYMSCVEVTWYVYRQKINSRSKC